MSDQKPVKWLSMGEAAKRTGAQRDTFRRRMLMLNHRHNGELLRPKSVGKKRTHYEVNPKALLYYQRSDLEWRDAESAQMRADIDETNRRLEALRDTVLAFRAKSLKWFKDHSE